MYDLPNIECICSAKSLSSGNQSLLTAFAKVGLGTTFAKVAFSG